MTGVYRVIAVSLISVFLSVILKELGFGGARILSGVAMVVVFFFATEGIRAICLFITGAADIGGLEKTLSAVFKIIGVGYLYGISSDICRELGENGVASAVQMAGRVEILLISLPFVAEIIGLAAEMLS